MTYTLSMTTCPRTQSTIVQSLTSLKASNYFGQLNVVEDTEQLGAFRNFDKALRQSIESGANIVGVIPDDMTYLPNWQELITPKFSDAGVGYVAIYTPKGCGQRHKFKRGFNACNMGWGGTWGGCYLFPVDVARKVVEHPFYIAHLNNELGDTSHLINYKWNKRIDHCIPEVVYQLGLDQLFYAPSICKHIGTTSTLGHVHTNAEAPYLR